MKKRMFTPEFFTDEDLVLNLDFAGRLFYLGTWSVAEDSGVISLSPFSLRMKVFPGDDISVEQIQGYIQKLIDLGKIITYESNGKSYGWLRNFHRHQKLDNPPEPVLPLPPWVEFIDSESRRGRKYEVDESMLESVLCPGRVPDTSEVINGHVQTKGKEKKRKEPTEVNEPNMDGLTSEQQQALQILYQITSLRDGDTNWIQNIATQYPDTDLAKTALALVTWLNERPGERDKKNANHRQRFLNFVKRAAESGENQHSLPREKETPIQKEPPQYLQIAQKVRDQIATKGHGTETASHFDSPSGVTG